MPGNELSTAVSEMFCGVPVMFWICVGVTVYLLAVSFVWMSDVAPRTVTLPKVVKPVCITTLSTVVWSCWIVDLPHAAA